MVLQRDSHNKSIVLGIDPGLMCTGWGVILKQDYEKYNYIASGTIETKEDKPRVLGPSSLAVRLGRIFTSLSNIIEKYSPNCAAIEATCVNCNSLSSLKLAHARAAAMLACEVRGLCLWEYAATNVKKSVAGSGSADKLQLQKMVFLHLGKDLKVSKIDEGDALALAICHAVNMRPY